jgi:pimeloyl-ACP methyl ester carboxylesterase
MKLELIKEAAQGPSRPVKLLFIHGICTSAWLWRPLFLPYFAGLGYESYALSLRGHGQSEGREDIRKFTLADFADDIGWALNEIGGPTVVVGFSLGGGVAQHYIQRGGKPAGVVLLNSAPPHGLIRAAAALMATNPKLSAEMRKVLEQGLAAANLNIIEDGLFSNPPPPELRRVFAAHICDIAETASRQLIGWLPFAPLPWSVPKLLVIGGERDEFIPATDVRLTAIYYGARAVILPKGAHAIMLDANWLEAADPIAEWLGKTFQ